MMDWTWWAYSITTLVSGSATSKFLLQGFTNGEVCPCLFTECAGASRQNFAQAVLCVQTLCDKMSNSNTHCNDSAGDAVTSYLSEQCYLILWSSSTLVNIGAT